MVNITLPDGSVKSFDGAVSGMAVAESIGAGLAKAALAVKVDGKQQDIYEPISHDAKLQILTSKDEEGLDIMRHTLTAQVLARAVKELWPDAQLAIGPTIKDGFYYDIDMEHKLTPDDLPKIEKKMLEIIDRNQPVKREIWDKKDAEKYFKDIGNTYKADIISRAPEGNISLYRQGDGDKHFMDLCFGPHIAATGKISKAFKLTKLAGAYWRGDSNNAQLQRIYGTMWANDKDLQGYLTRIEEAEKRDHRKLGVQLDLFHIQEEATGQVFWHDKGYTLYRLLENFIRDKIRREGYIEVKTPILVDKVLWEKSGHWEKFREDMFTAESEEKILCIKPMNCPCHVQIFNKKTVSYRDLPIRMAEFGSCHRNEPSGALHGIMRVRGFVQDDAHIFCMEDQINEEVTKFCELLKTTYKQLGFENILVKFSTRPEKRAGTDATWDKAEKALADACKAANLEYVINPGEGAFYGPKLEFTVRDSLEREWQCGTIQVDFVLPERLDANYIGADNQKHRPVMLHRAILGSMERFIGILIEHHGGAFPLWLAPVQVAIATIVDDAIPFAQEVKAELEKRGMRVELDLRGEQISYKVREHSHAKVPVIIALGKQEVEKRTVAIRRLGSQKQEFVALDEALKALAAEAKAPN